MHAKIRPGAEILDLGCGVGRIAHELLLLGHPVVAVDESAADGVVLIERHEPGWTPEEGVLGTMGEVTIALEDVRIDPPVVSATVRYEADGRTWRHPFDARIFDNDGLDRELRAAGLRLSRVLDERGAWVEALLYSTA